MAQPPNVTTEPATVNVVSADANNDDEPVLNALVLLTDGSIGGHVVEWSEIKHESRAIVTRRTLGCQTFFSLEGLNLNAVLANPFFSLNHCLLRIHIFLLSHVLCCHYS